MPMNELEREVSEIRYQIKRKEIELEHLNKYADLKTKRRLLGIGEGADIETQERTLRAEIGDLEEQIRRIENREIRKQNLR